MVYKTEMLELDPESYLRQVLFIERNDAKNYSKIVRLPKNFFKIIRQSKSNKDDLLLLLQIRLNKIIKMVQLEVDDDEFINSLTMEEQQLYKELKRLISEFTSSIIEN